MALHMLLLNIMLTNGLVERVRDAVTAPWQEVEGTNAALGATKARKSAAESFMVLCVLSADSRLCCLVRPHCWLVITGVSSTNKGHTYLTLTLERFCEPLPISRTCFCQCCLEEALGELSFRTCWPCRDLR